jgi:hypothetical protein
LVDRKERLARDDERMAGRHPSVGEGGSKASNGASP